MDPLSVAASIVGILAAAGKISELLHCVVSSAKDAPHVVTALAFEVDDVRTAVSALQGLLMHHLISAPSRRTKLIQLDRLIVTLTEMVLTFSELETAVSPMVVPEGGKTPLKTRLRWPRIESDCSKMVEKLQRHKASVSLMLNILQCESDAEATRSQAHLEALVETLLLSNQELCQRMRALEGSWDARSVYTKKTNTNTLGLVPQEDSETIIPATPRLPNNYASGFEAIRIRRAFEDDLEASRVYTRAALYDFCDRSFVSSAIRTSAWSILSLSDISVISVLALPLFQGDISNQEHYSFGDIDAAQVLGSAALRTMGQSVAQNKLPPIIVNSLEGDGKRDDIVITQSTELVVSGTSRDAENTTPLPKDDGYDEWYAKNIYLCKGCGKPPRDDDDDLLIIKGTRWHGLCFLNSNSYRSVYAQTGFAIFHSGLRFCVQCMRRRILMWGVNTEKKSSAQIEQLVYCVPCQCARLAAKRSRLPKTGSARPASKPREAGIADRPARESSRESKRATPYQNIEHTFLDLIYYERMPDPEFWTTTALNQLSVLYGLTTPPLETD